MAPLRTKDTNKPGKKPSTSKPYDKPSGEKENAIQASDSTEKPTENPVSNTSPSNPNDEISDLESEYTVEIKWNCNQIRTKITTYVNNTSTTLKDFQSKLKISPSSYRTFMSQSGPYAGAGSDAYMAAHHFFSKREAAGLKMPRAPAASKKKASTEDPTSKKSAAKEEVDKFDVSNITLDGEAAGTIPVYDTCNDVRTKIKAHLRRNNVTQAAFARAISACQGENSTPIQGKQITDFCNKGKRGPMSGNTSKAFYGAYVYFEKLRIKDGKKKSKKREEMEREYGAAGVDRERVSENVGVWAHASESVRVNNLGRVEIF